MAATGDRQDHLPLLRGGLRRAGGSLRRRATLPSAATPTIRQISAGSAPRARRWPKRSAWKTGCCSLKSHGGRASWDEALDLVASTFTRDDRRARTGRGRVLRLRPAADRGLLRRQQADEGLHRLGQHRHQLAALHGLVGRRPPARLRLRHRARHATRISNSPISSCSSAPTSPGAIPVLYQRIAAAKEKRPEHEDRAHRSAPHDDGGHRRPASADQARWRRRAVRSDCLRYLASSRALDRDVHRRAYQRLRRGAATPPTRSTLYDVVAADGPHGRDAGEVLTLCSPRPRRPSPSTARASTSRRPAPTRSTPSSTATWRPAASASRAWGRSRSPASRTPWAGARSAASPTCSPRTWTSKTPAHRDRVQRFWRSPTIATQARPQGRRHVPRRRRRPHQGAVDHGDQPGRLDAGRRCTSKRRSAPARSSSSRT